MIYRLLIAILLLPSVVFGGQGMGPGPGVKGYAATNYCASHGSSLICQDFEGTTTPPTGWSMSAGTATIDWHNTTSPLNGAKSLTIVNTGTTDILTTPTFTAQSELWLGMMLTCVSKPTNYTNLFSIRSGASGRGGLFVDSTGKLIPQAYGGTTATESSASYVNGSTIYIKIHATTGTGNASVIVWVSADGVTWGSPRASSTDGTFTETWGQVMYYSQPGSSYKIDNFRVETSDFNF